MASRKARPVVVVAIVSTVLGLGVTTAVAAHTTAKAATVFQRVSRTAPCPTSAPRPTPVPRDSKPSRGIRRGRKEQPDRQGRPGPQGRGAPAIASPRHRATRVSARVSPPSCPSTSGWEGLSWMRAYGLRTPAQATPRTWSCVISASILRRSRLSRWVSWVPRARPRTTARSRSLAPQRSPARPQERQR
jgi:hypothetical protein